MEASRTRKVPSAVSLSFSLTSSLEMSPQYHSASCRAMLLFIPLLVTDVGLGGFGGRAASGWKERSIKSSAMPRLEQQFGVQQEPSSVFSTPLIKRRGGGTMEARGDDTGVRENKISFRKKALTEYSRRHGCAGTSSFLRIMHVHNKNG